MEIGDLFIEMYSPPQSRDSPSTCSSMSLPNLLELEFNGVTALPKASRSGFTLSMIK